MREILFRGKRKDNREWVEGYYFIDERDIEDGIIWRDIPQIQQRYGDHFNYFDVDPSTIGQFTGLTDKNGKRIFEGDIVYGQSIFHSTKELFSCVFRNGGFWFNGKMHDDCDYCLDNLIDAEVIDNIHDNPDLLKIKGDAV